MLAQAYRCGYVSIPAPGAPRGTRGRVPGTNQEGVEMAGGSKRMVPLACAVVVVAAVGTGVANARTDTAAGPAAKAADTLTVMGFGTNGDEVAKSRFELAQKAVG